MLSLVGDTIFNVLEHIDLPKEIYIKLRFDQPVVRMTEICWKLPGQTQP